MDINVTIQATDLAEAICKLADAIAAKAVSAETPEIKKRTRRSSTSARTQEQAVEQAAVQSPVTQPAQTVTTAPTPPVQVVTPAQQQPGYWPQGAADGKIIQAPMPPFNNPAPTPAPPTYVAPVPVQAPPLQTSVPQYTVEQLGVAAMPLMDAGRQGDLLQLLANFGVQSVQELPKERYAEFAMALRQLGAKI
jgi:hypothetical protein